MIVTAVFVTTLSLLTTLTLAVPTRRAISFIQNIATNGDFSLCIVPAGNAVGNGTPVQLAPCDNGGTPWAYDDTAGTFSLTGTNQCLDIKDGINADGTRLQTWECTGGPNQKFEIIDGPWSDREIQWVGSNKCLDVTNFSPGTPLQIWDCSLGPNQLPSTNQIFSFRDPDPFRFTTTAHPNMCITIAGGAIFADGASLQLSTCIPALMPNSQTFTPSDAGFHVPGPFAIDLTNGDQSNGNKLQIWTFFPGNTNQRWFYDAANKAVRLTTNPNKCMDVTDGVFANGTKLQIWDCYFGPNQQFTLAGFG